MIQTDKSYSLTSNTTLFIPPRHLFLDWLIVLGIKVPAYILPPPSAPKNNNNPTYTHTIFVFLSLKSVFTPSDAGAVLEIAKVRSGLSYFTTLHKRVNELSNRMKLGKYWSKHVTCHVSHIMCHMSHVTSKLFFFRTKCWS